jgi:hypothetical protein
MSNSENKISEWGYRYGKNGSITGYSLKEDEQLFKEHQEHIKKNISKKTLF